MGEPRIFKTKWFQRFARKEGIEDEVLLEAIGRAEKGLTDANLGGGVIKQRIPRRGQGRSGGYRTIIVFRRGDRAVFMYGFAKSDRADIGPDEEKEFKEAAKHILALTENQLTELVTQGDFVEAKTA
jgi:hypothetical protein